MDRRWAAFHVLALFPLVTAFAEPVINKQNAVVNSASYRTPGMPGSGVAQGSIFSIFGTGLGPTTYVQAPKIPLDTGLATTSVTVTVGGISTQALVLFSYSTQVNAIMPSTTPIGTGTVTVTYNTNTSAPAPIQVVASAFGTFTYNSMGFGQAIATDTIYHSNTIIHTFHPGDYATLWGTGLGPISSSDAQLPPVGNLPGPISVHVGNTAAPVTYHGRAPSYPGLDQIDFQIPPGIVGCYVPVGVETAGGLSNITTIAVSASGQTCSDSVMGQDLVDKLSSGQKVDFGYIRLESFIGTFLAGSADYSQVDMANATFSEFTPGNAGLAQYGVSSGYCVAVDCSHYCTNSMYLPTMADSSGAPILDAGAISVQYAPVITLARYGGFYSSLLAQNGAEYLWSGLKYEVTGVGGPNVGVFSVTDATSIPSTKFTNVERGQTLSRSADLTIQWSGGDPALQNGQVTIGGYSITSTDFTQVEALECTAPLSAGQITIPGWVLSALPPSGTGSTGTITYPLGWIWIGQYNKPTTFKASGLDRGIITDAFFNQLGVTFR